MFETFFKKHYRIEKKPLKPKNTAPSDPKKKESKKIQEEDKSCSGIEPKKEENVILNDKKTDDIDKFAKNSKEGKLYCRECIHDSDTFCS